MRQIGRCAWMVLTALPALEAARGPRCYGLQFGCTVLVARPKGRWVLREWDRVVSGERYGKLSRSGEKVGAHRISWELHFGPILAGLQVLHRCDNPPCVNPAHLFLGTSADNMRDMHAKGRATVVKARGEAHPRARLTVASVASIRLAHASGDRTGAQLARDYGVTKQAIQSVVRGETWRHVLLTPDELDEWDARLSIVDGKAPVNEHADPVQRIGA